MIYKSATHAATITWNNGNRGVALYVGSNRSTGETIVWQVVKRNGKLGRSTRITGSNIAKLAAEIRQYVPAEGSMVVHNQAAFDVITARTRACPRCGVTLTEADTVTCGGPDCGV